MTWNFIPNRLLTATCQPVKADSFDSARFAGQAPASACQETARAEAAPAGTKARRTLDLILLHGEQGQVVGAREVASQQVPQRDEALAGRHGARVRVEEVVDEAQRVGLRELDEAALRSALEGRECGHEGSAPLQVEHVTSPEAAVPGQRLKALAA